MPKIGANYLYTAGTGNSSVTRSCRWTSDLPIAGYYPFTVSATGTAPLSYQWRFNGTNLTSGTASAYTCYEVRAKDAGSYSVVVTNMAGTVTSTDALLTVTQPAPPRIDSIPFTSGGQIRLQISGAPGHYAIEAGSNLVNWSGLTNFTTTNTAFQYLDPETNLIQRFYRALLTP